MSCTCVSAALLLCLTLSLAGAHAASWTEAVSPRDPRPLSLLRHSNPARAVSQDAATEPYAQAIAAQLRGLQAFNCTCADKALCKPVTVRHDREFFGFVYPASKNFRLYDWDVLTTVAWLDDPEVVCLAHAHSARVVINAGDLGPALASLVGRLAWVKGTVQKVMLQALDGVNFDYEGPLPPGSPTAVAYTQLVALTKRTLALLAPGTQVSVDVPWSPYDVDGRNYDWPGLAASADLLFVMSYDMQSQIWGRCVASANSPMALLLRGLHQWLSLGVAADKLVLGLPWYGYDYPCVPNAHDAMVDPAVDVCMLPAVPFAGALCSDAAGVQRSYTDLQQILRLGLNTTAVACDDQQVAKRFNWQEQGSAAVRQVWYDDPETLLPKYRAAAQLGLRGVGCWNLEWLYQPGEADDPEQQATEAAAMWQALKDGFVAGTRAIHAGQGAQPA